MDESLKSKLKCLVFIPIISRTFCDPKSFAWEHEFKAFVEMASQDQCGLKVKLPGGNVANRILPVQIHELDKDDKKLLEGELGGFLRSIGFIYQEPGVNRPLTPRDDDERKNLKNIRYRNQINKVANSINEIITAMGHTQPEPLQVSGEMIRPLTVAAKKNKTPLLAGLILSLALITLGILLVPKLFNPARMADKPIAVLPFDNFITDPEQEYFADGMFEEILDRLYKIGGLQIIKCTPDISDKNSKLSLRKIAMDLGVSSILEGSVRKSGNNVRITAQLIDA